MADNPIDCHLPSSKRSLRHGADSSPKRSKLPVVDSLPVRSRILAPANAPDGEKPIADAKATPSSGFTHQPLISHQQTSPPAACWTSSLYQDTDSPSSAPTVSSGTCSFSRDTSTSDTSLADDSQLSDDPNSDSCTTPVEQLHHLAPVSSSEPTASRTLPADERLKNIWPDFPLPGLSEAPLAVRWEVTRIAQHCDLTSSDCDLPYEPSCNLWTSQSTLRERFSIREKPLPRRSDEKAWQAGLRDFRLEENAVVLSAVLVSNNGKSGPPFHLQLSPLELHLSHRLERRFGADRFLSIYMLSHVAEQALDWLVKTRHYFLGRLWQAFYMEKSRKTPWSTAPDALHKTAQHKSQQVRIMLFATDGDHFRTCSEPGGLPPGEEALDVDNRKKMSLGRFLSWTIGFDNCDNKKQPLPKLFSRIALSLTRCRATLVLGKEQIRHRTNDIRSTEALLDGAVMNDGIGRMSQSLAKKIATYLGLDDYPCCFQGRFGSAKGIWICATGADQGRDWIETFPSQRKWKCNYNDALHRTFEVHSWPRKPKPARLNRQFIPLLEHRARDPSAMRRRFAQLVAQDISEDLDQLMAALGDRIDMRQWLHQQGRDASHDVHKTVPFLGALPRWTEDEVAFMLDAGFDHRKLQRLSDKCFELGQRAMERIKTKMHIRVPQSTNLLMVVDFDGVLAENEVHIHFSCTYRAGAFCDMMLNDRDVLVARSPAHLPSDIRKVRAVLRPELHRLGNVVVFSTKGARPLADFLSGGDYDGDVAWVCFDDAIVDNFSNCDVPASDLVADGFIRVLGGSVWDMQQQEGLSDDAACAEFMTRAFRFNAQPSLLGICTKFKEKLCYWRNDVGGAHATTLGHLLAQLVDQPKQGLLFDADDWLAMRRRLNLAAALPDPAYTLDKPPIVPARQTTRHILDHLKFDVAYPRVDEACIQLSRRVKAHDAQHFDAELTCLYNYYDDLAGADPIIKALMTELKRDLHSLLDASRAVSATDGSYATRMCELHEQWQAISPRLQPTDADAHASRASSQEEQDADSPPNTHHNPPNTHHSSQSTHHVHGTKKTSRTLEKRSTHEKRSPQSTSMPPHVAQTLVEPWIHDSDQTRWSLLKASTTFSLLHRASGDLVWRVAGRSLCFLKAQRRAPVVVCAEMYRALKPNSRFIQRRRAAAAHGSGSACDVGAFASAYDVGVSAFASAYDVGALASSSAYDVAASAHDADWADSDMDLESDYWDFDPQNFD